MTEPMSDAELAAIRNNLGLRIDTLGPCHWSDMAALRLLAEVQRLREYVAIIQHEEAFTKAYCGPDSDATVMELRVQLAARYSEEFVAVLRNGLNEWIAANAPGGWIDDLREQVEELKSSSEHEILVHAESHARSVREKDGLRAALHKYGRHSVLCIRLSRPLSQFKCECGYDAALRASEPKVE